MLIGERDACAVILHFTDNGHRQESARISQSIVASLHPLVDFGRRIRISEREHRAGMHYLSESVGQVGTYAPAWRQRVVELWILKLESLEFFHEHVIFAVGNFRVILHIVETVVAVELITQLPDALFWGHCGGSVLLMGVNSKKGHKD